LMGRWDHCGVGHARVFKRDVVSLGFLQVLSGVSPVV
jgi:hypothetical protein